MEKTNKIELDLSTSISKLKGELADLSFSMTGKSKNFTYFELKDFLPTASKLFAEYGINDIFNIIDNTAYLTLEKGEETRTYQIPFIHYATPTANRYNKDTKQYESYNTMSDIQNYGAMITYHKRYLYQNALNVSEGDIVESQQRFDNAVRDLNFFIQDNELDNLKVFKLFHLTKSSNAVDLENALTDLKKMKKAELAKLAITKQEPIKKPEPKPEPKPVDKVEQDQNMVAEPVETEAEMVEVEVVKETISMDELPFDDSTELEVLEQVVNMTPKQKLFAELDEVIATKKFDKTKLYNHYKITDKTTMKQLQDIIIGLKAVPGRN